MIALWIALSVLAVYTIGFNIGVAWVLHKHWTHFHHDLNTMVVGVQGGFEAVAKVAADTDEGVRAAHAKIDMIRRDDD